MCLAQQIQDQLKHLYSKESQYFGLQKNRRYLVRTGLGHKDNYGH